MRAALKGQSFKGDNLLSAEIERYADTSAEQSYQTAARKMASRNNIRRGGVAAIYRSPYQDNRLAAVITNSPQQPFAQSVKTLTEDAHWNALEGSVARWNKKSVLMAELSAPISGFERSEVFEAPSLFDGGLRSVSLPDFSAVSFNVAQFKPSIDWASLKDKAIFWGKTETNEASILLAEAKTPNETLSVQTPAQAPMSVSTPAKVNKAPVFEARSDIIRTTKSEPRLASESYSYKMASVTEKSLKKGQSFLDSVLPESTIEKANKALTGSPSQRQSILRGLSEQSKSSSKSNLPNMDGLDRKASALLDASSKKFTDFKDGLKDFKIGERIANAQKKWRPIGNSWRAKIRKISVPGESAAKWSIRQISAAGLLLMLIFGFVIYFLGLSSATNRTGDHH